MRRILWIAATIFFLSLPAVGQTPDHLTFEVASVKRTPPPEPGARVFYGPPRGGPGTADPAQITWTNAALRNILMTAYDVQTNQVTAPDWLGTERYDIIAKVPAGATKAQVNVMWQNLLKERFGVVLHHESKELPVAELTVAKGGSKLKETGDPNIEPFTPNAGPLKVNTNGLPQMNGSGAIVSIFPTANGANARMVAKALSLPDIASRLAATLRRPVIDKTGLTGKYDFILEFTPDLSGIPLPPAFSRQDGNGASDPGSDIVSAVEKQLGLKLTSTKGNLDVIVVDRAEKIPTEN